MLCVTLKEFARACAPVSGGISDIAIFDPNDYNFTQPSAILGVNQAYNAISLRAGANGTGGTGATCTVTISTLGITGDNISLALPNGMIIGWTTQTVTETTVTLLAAKLVLNINGYTITSGYSATNLAGVITITAPAGLGATVNGHELVIDDEGMVTSRTAFAGGVNGTGLGKMYMISFLRDEAEWTWKQSVKGCSTKYEHAFNFQLPENSQNLTTFMEALDAASCCCGLGMAIRLNDGKVFIAGEKYVNGTSISRFSIVNNGSNGTTGKLYDDFNGGNMILAGSYSRSLYQFTGGWEDIESFL